MFHDTLPGSSIHLAVEDYDRKFAEIHQTAKDLFHEAIKALSTDGSSSRGLTIFNTLPSHARREIVCTDMDGPCVVTVGADSLCGEVQALQPQEGVQGQLTRLRGPWRETRRALTEVVFKKGDAIKMSNSSLEVIITRGRLTSVYDKAEK